MLDDLEYALYDEIHQTYVMTARAGEDGTAVFYNVRPSTYTVSFALPDNSQPVAGAGTFTQDGRTMVQSGIEIRAGDPSPIFPAGSSAPRASAEPWRRTRRTTRSPWKARK